MRVECTRRRRLCDEENRRMRGGDHRKRLETRLKVHPAQEVVQENEEKMSKGEAALVQSKERKHPHFAQFEIKTY